MSQTQTTSQWDFTQVFNLLDALKVNDSPAPTSLDRSPLHTHNTQQSRSDVKHTPGKSKAGLGDFSQIWQFLGSPDDIAAPKIPPAPDASPTLERRIPGKIEYTSDGAVYSVPAYKKSKGIQWRDETADGALTDVAPTKSDIEEERLTKKQRYKRNKKERQKLEQMDTPRKTTSDYESEGDMQNFKITPARKASTHNLKEAATPAVSVPKPDVKSGDMNGNAAALNKSPQKEVEKQSKPQKIIAVPSSEKTTISSSPEKTAAQTIPKSRPAETQTRQHSEPALKALDTPTSKATKKEWPISNPYSSGSKSLLPASVQPNRQKTSVNDTPFKSTDSAIEYVQTTPSRSSRPVIQPKIIRSGEDRHWAFLLKLIANFYSDRASLIRPANLTTHSNDPKGIHVFVDASNIFIGFHDQLKRARGIAPHVRVPQVNLSFDALALLMERRRSVAKRVLAGSTPHIAAFDVAKSVGYELSILDKVWKAKELTDRQKFFKEQENKRRNYNRNPYSTSAGDASGSGSDTANAPTHAPEKFVEQGVDEIIHLKILESVVDVEEPTTIVLATGDAAIAEYSAGFMVMVERALKKGWTVELVSWSANISTMYKKASFRRQWGDKFRIIELDDYAEELLDM